MVANKFLSALRSLQENVSVNVGDLLTDVAEELQNSELTSSGKSMQHQIL